MEGATSHWEDELESWLKPFLDHLGHKARRRMCPRFALGTLWEDSWRIAEVLGIFPGPARL
jgi:hypothetical protein